MTSALPSRRAVVRTAAWSVPAVTIATAAPAFAASPTYTAAGPTTFVYDSPYGQFNVTVTSTHVPQTAAAGSALDAPDFTAVIVIPSNLVDAMRDALGVVEVSGSADASYTGAGTTASLTVPPTAVPASGELTLTAAGAGQASTAPGTAGSVDIVIGDIIANLMLTNGAGDSNPFPITLTPAAPPNTFHTYTVA